MIEIGGRDDVFVQWFSDAFIRENEDVFKKVIMQPGEAMFTIKNGKPGEIVTEAGKTTVLPGFLGKLREAVAGKKDIQAMYLDMKSRVVQIPLSGFLKDRIEIKCVANMMVKITRENILRVINMLNRNLISDAKWGSQSNAVKEICNEDIANFFAYDTKVIVDSFVFTKFESSYIREHAAEFNQAIMDAINNLMPHWAEIGLEVSVTSVDVSENMYEDVMKFKAMMSQNMLIEDIKFENQKEHMDNVANLELARIKNEGSINIQKIQNNYNAMEKETQNRWNLELMQADHDMEVSEKKRADKLAEAKNNEEIRVLQGFNDAKIKEMAVNVDLYKESGESDIKIKLMKATTDDFKERESLKLDVKHKNELAEIQKKYSSMIADAESAVPKAYQEGYNKGLDQGRKDSSEAAYNKGFADALLRQQDSKDISVMANGGMYNNMSAMGYRPSASQMQSSQFQQQFASPQSVQQENSNEIMFCCKCGCKLSSGALFCPKCGNKL